MERKKLSEVAELKIKNCNLILEILRIQMGQVLEEKNRIIMSEFKRLRCKPEEWQLDERTGELIKKENNIRS